MRRFLFLLLVLLIVVLHAAFTFIGLLYKPAVLWVAIPTLTVGVYVYAGIKGSAMRLDVILTSLLISVLLSYSLFAGYFASINSPRPLYETLIWGVAYFLLSNVLTVSGSALSTRIRPTRARDRV